MENKNVFITINDSIALRFLGVIIGLLYLPFEFLINILRYMGIVIFYINPKYFSSIRIKYLEKKNKHISENIILLKELQDNCKGKDLNNK